MLFLRILILSNLIKCRFRIDEYVYTLSVYSLFGDDWSLRFCALTFVGALFLGDCIMDNDFSQRVKQELDKQVQEHLKKMNEEEKAAKARKGRFIFVIVRIVCIYLLICSPISATMTFLITFGNGADSNPPVMLIPLLIVIIPCAIFFLIFSNKQLKKPNEEFAASALRRELKSSVILQIETQGIRHTNNRSDFSVDQEILLLTTTNGQKLLIDNKHQLFAFIQTHDSPTKLYSYRDLIRYEIYEDGTKYVEGRAGSALVGGFFFGLGGAIVGSARSRNVKSISNNLKLILYINDFDSPQLQFIYNTRALNKASDTYKSKVENLHSVCSILEYMLNQKTLEESAKVAVAIPIATPIQSTIDFSAKEQLQELKTMLNEGLITKEDFDKKKKQILGL